MNGDTIVLNTIYPEVHRAKRIKLDEVRARNNSRPKVDHMSRDWFGTQHAVAKIHAIKVNVGKRDIHLGKDATTLASQAVQTDVMDSASTTSDELGTNSVNAAVHSALQPSEMMVQSSAKFKNPDIDFSSAPSDPIELVWWVIQQATHFQREIVEEDSEERVNLLHPSGVRARRSDANLDQQQLAERERVREENRARKKRWRKENTEKNRDNDLRCRINIQAKGLFGVEESAAKTLYIEAEFNKRRTIREARQRSSARLQGDVPSFSFTPDLLKQLFTANHSASLSNEVKRAGELLINSLFGVRSNGVRHSSTEAATTLRHAIDEGTVNTQSFVEALKIMATNEDLMEGIRATLNEITLKDINSSETTLNDSTLNNDTLNGMRGDAELDIPGEEMELDKRSGDENSHQPHQLPAWGADFTTSQAPAVYPRSAEIIKAIEETNVLLNAMAHDKTYDSPYGNPAPTNTRPAVRGLNFLNGTSGPSGPDISSALDSSQIDAFLALANGGSLSDDEDDDKTIADPDELDREAIELSGTPPPDEDVAAHLQRIIADLMAKRNANRSQNESRRLSDDGDAQSVREQAAKLLSTFKQGGVAVNTIMPVAQARVTSELYAHLSSRARTEIPSIDINSAQSPTANYAMPVEQTRILNPKPFNTNPTNYLNQGAQRHIDPLHPSVQYNPTPQREIDLPHSAALPHPYQHGTRSYNPNPFDPSSHHPISYNQNHSNVASLNRGTFRPNSHNQGSYDPNPYNRNSFTPISWAPNSYSPSSYVNSVSSQGPHHPRNQPQAGLSTPRPRPALPLSRIESADEQRKIISYGFPPLPGTRGGSQGPMGDKRRRS